MRSARAPRSPVGLVPRRIRTHPVLVAAAWLTVLLSTAVLTALLAYGSTVPEEGLTQVLTADPARAAVLVTAGAGSDAGATVDPALRALVSRTLSAVPHEVTGAVQSAPFLLTSGARGDASGALTSFWAMDGLARHAELRSGSWPSAAGQGTDPVEVAVGAAAAAAMGVEVGDRLALQSATFAPDVTAVVTAVYEPRDPTDPVWRLDPTGGAGVRPGEHPAYGPLAVPPESIAARAPASAGASWLVVPDLTEVHADDLAALTDGLAALQAGATAELGTSAHVTSGLGSLLEQAARSLVVSRSTTPVPALLLALIAAYAITHVGRLLLGERSVERALLRARGASRWQDVRGALLEAVLLVLPAALLAPLVVLALAPLARGAYGTTRPVPLTLILPIVAVVAAVAVVVLALPALTAPDPAGSGRPPRDAPRPAWQRAGLDLVVVALAVATYLLLRTAGSPFAAANLRDVQADPVFVLAPVALLLSVSLLALRVLPLLGRVVDRTTSRTRGAGVALGLWPVARRPARHAGPLLLLVLAVSVGVMAVAATATGSRSRTDQADFAAGADLRADLSPGASLPAEALTLSGVTATMPVHHLSADTGARDGVATPVLALDAATAPHVVRLRPDLLPAGMAAYADLATDPHGSGTGAVPALASRALLAARGLSVGETLDTVVLGTAVPVRVVAQVEAYPTVGTGESLVVDAERLRNAIGTDLPAVDQWWLGVDPAAAGDVASTLERLPEVSAVVDRLQLATELTQDPLAEGFAGALRIALVGAALLAVVGVAVGVLLTGRERREELGLLAALGAPPRQVRSALLLEQATVLALGLLLGLVVGLVVAWLVLPWTTVSARTGAVVPVAVVTVPWGAVLALLALLGLTLLATSAAVTAAARRGRPGLTLREAAP